MKDLHEILKKYKCYDTILFDWFGGNSGQPETIEILIGEKIPIEMAQAVIKVFSSQKDIPIILSRSGPDTDYAQSVIIGSLDLSGNKPLSKKKIKNLLKSNLTQQKFMEYISE